MHIKFAFAVISETDLVQQDEQSHEPAAPCVWFQVPQAVGWSLILRRGTVVWTGTILQQNYTCGQQHPAHQMVLVQ
jgi:hypothetical protein